MAPVPVQQPLAPIFTTSTKESVIVLNIIPEPTGVPVNPIHCIGHCSATILNDNDAGKTTCTPPATKTQQIDLDVPTVIPRTRLFLTTTLVSGLSINLVDELSRHMKVIHNDAAETSHFKMDVPFSALEFIACSGMMLLPESTQRNITHQLGVRSTLTFHITWVSHNSHLLILRAFLSFLISASDKSSIHLAINVETRNYGIMYVLNEMGFRRLVNTSIQNGLIKNTICLFYRLSSPIFTLDHYMSIVNKELVIKV
jgi:hypothetical protein